MGRVGISLALALGVFVIIVVLWYLSQRRKQKTKEGITTELHRVAPVEISSRDQLPCQYCLELRLGLLLWKTITVLL